MDIRINYRGKKICVRNPAICRSFFSKLRGLMFRKNPKPLLFLWKKPVKRAIHSFFVFQQFLAVWMLKGKVVDAKIVKPWAAYIMPEKRFDAMLEAPLNTIKK